MNLLSSETRWPSATEGREAVAELELRLERRFGQYVVAVNSGTTALEAILVSFGVGPDRPVIVPEYGFPAAALVAHRLGAEVRVVQVDSDLSLDPLHVAGARVEDQPVIVGIDVCGYPAAWSKLRASAPYCILVEDACAAWGGMDKGGQLAGTLADAAALSLSDTKVMAAGEGGVVVTRNAELAQRVALLRRYGEGSGSKGRHRHFGQAGGNWKMAGSVARLALQRLDELDDHLEAARRARRIWDFELEGCKHLRARVPEHDKIAPHKYRVSAYRSCDRDALVEIARELGIPVMEDDVAPLWQQPLWLTRVPRESAASNILARSFIVGSRDKPMWTLREDEVAEIATAFVELDERASEWLR